MSPPRVEVGDTILLDGERLLVREIDRSTLSKNLGLLVCPVEDRDNDWNPRNRWVSRTAEFVVIPRENETSVGDPS